MAFSKRFHAYVISCLVLAVALVIAAATPMFDRTPKVAANGFTVPIAQGKSGPYEYIVGIWPPDPTVGNLHLAISLTANERPVTEATVTVTGRANGGTVVEGPLPAVGYFLQPWSYELDMNLSEPGQWTFEVAVDSPLGTTAFEALLEVPDGQGATSSTGNAQGAPGRELEDGGLNWVIFAAPLVILAMSLAAWQF